MRKVSLLFFLVLACVTSFAQVVMVPGEWRMMSAYHDATKSVKAFSRIFVLSDGALYSYDDGDNSIQTYDKSDILNDGEICDIEYCSTEKALMICYASGNIDLLYSDDRVVNIPDILFSSLQDKKPNELKVYGSQAYISSNSGIVSVNLKKKEITDTYEPGGKVRSSLLYKDCLICVCDNGLFSGNVSDNLKDPAKWKKLNDKNTFLKLQEYDDNVIANATDRVLYYINADDGQLAAKLYNVKDFIVSGNTMYIIKPDCITVSSTEKDNVTEYKTELKCKNILKDSNTLWISSGEKGLLKCSIKDENIVIHKSGILPDSPVRNYFDFMSFSPSGELLVAGGSHNYSGISFEGTLMSYNNGKWYNFPEDEIEDQTGTKYENLTSIVADPYKHGHYFASSAGHGIYEYDDGQFIKNYSCENSPLKTILPDDRFYLDYVRVNGLQYDSEGNLWMLNNEVDTIFRILGKDGQWKALYYPELAGMKRFRSIYFDSNNEHLIWTANTWLKAGLMCIDTNGTTFDDADDKHYFSGNNITNQDGVTVTVNDITFFEEDHDGTMWIGSDQGIFILKTPDTFINDRVPVFERIKIPRDDGSGLADYLMSTVYTTAICIDPANRKWIGTIDSGVFLLDETGQHTLLHFDTDNSPLLSDNILNIKVNSLTGEVFIGTDKGLSVYGGNAFKSAENLKKHNISVFPNPVLPEYEDKVTVMGLTENSTVKILNSSGRLVYESKSDGGGFTWNCVSGRGRVPSGIYYILVTDSSGESSIVSSVTVIR